MYELIFTGAIPTRVQALAIGSAFVLLLFIIGLIRGGRLKEGYALVWITIPIITLAFAFFSQLLSGLSAAIGIVYPPAAFFLLSMGGLYLLGIHFSLLLHRYDQRIRRLSQEHAILKEELSRQTHL